MAQWLAWVEGLENSGNFILPHLRCKHPVCIYLWCHQLTLVWQLTLLFLSVIPKRNWSDSFTLCVEMLELVPVSGQSDRRRINHSVRGKYFMDFQQTYSIDAFQDRDECFRSWGQKVKVQGHSGMNYAWNSIYRTETFTTRRLASIAVCSVHCPGTSTSVLFYNQSVDYLLFSGGGGNF